MNALTPVSKPNHLYAQMQTAVGQCYSVDDCAGIAKHADGIAAYFKQISDHDLVKKFMAIKVRAWRRIGEIFLAVEGSDCETQGAYIRKIRKHFGGDPSVMAMSDSAITNALKLGKLPVDFFEREVGSDPNIYRIMTAYKDLMRQEWENSPEGQKEIARQKVETEKWQAVAKKQDAIEAVKQAEAAARLAKEKERLQKEQDQLYLDHQAMEAARDEVGYTMERHDRESMKTIVFIIKEPTHAVLRQAAFDNRMTMQAILRAGLAMWLISRGYPFDMDGMGLPTPPPPKGGTSPQPRQ